MTRRPTQADVARLAGVSRATVSYVVNGLADNQVAITAETRQRVLQAVQQLGYRPDARAQSLRSGLTHTIGLLIPDMHNPHFWQMANGVEQQLQLENYDLLLTSTSLNPDREVRVVDALSRRRIDGLILLLTFPERFKNHINKLVETQMPVVVVMDKFANAANQGDFPYDRVEPTYLDGAAQAMQHLLDLGHQRVGFIYGVAQPLLGLDRLIPYYEGLKNAGLPVSEELIEKCGTTLESGYQAAMRLLDREPRPTALMVINDLLAISALRAIADRGLRVPADISVVSFDDIEMAAYTNPSLTTLKVNTEEMGRTAARLLLMRLQNPSLPLQYIQMPGRLVVRGSTGPAPR